MKTHNSINTIYQGLRKKIIDRSLPPNTKLSENLLSKEWNVSRTPIREVLRRLESEGLVASSRFKGFIVNSISLEDIDQIYPIKISLEGLAGRLATPIISGDPEKMRTIKRLCREMDNLSKKMDVQGYTKNNSEFHVSVWHWCGNPWLIRILDNLSSQLDRFIVNALHVPHRMERSVKEHWKIVEAFETGNGRAVEKSLGSHFKKASEDLKRELIR